MANETESESHFEEERLHHSHSGRYALVWIALLILTGLTWALSRVHLAGHWNVTVALGIASAKSALVALFFMHLWDQRGANRLVFITSIVFVALLIGITLADYATRFPLANPPESELGGWPAVAPAPGAAPHGGAR